MKTDRERAGLTGLVKTVVLFHEEAELPFETVSYDRDGSRIEGLNFPFGQVRIIPNYDANGKIIKSTYLRADDSLAGWRDYIYDNDQNKVECLNYSADNQLITKEILLYDSNKNLAEVNFYGADGILEERRVCTYNENKTINRLTSYLKDFWYVVKYDSNRGFVTSFNSYNNENAPICQVSYSYDTFDSIGNWLKQNILTLDLTSKEERYMQLCRTITYY